MKVHELIAELLRMPADLEVRIWDDAAAEYVPVFEAMHEDGTSSVDLMPWPSSERPDTKDDGE